jgi:hypothetical protein
VLSQPVNIRWLGWETDTYRLQDAGWELSAQEDIPRQQMAIAMRHKTANIRGICESINWDYFRRERDIYVGRSMSTFRANLAMDFIVNYHQAGMTFDDFNPIDARPMYQDINMEKRSLDDLAHFRKLEKAKDEIFLKPASMEEILDMALKQQEPNQEAIRKEMVRKNELEIMRKSQLRANLRLVG